MTYKSNAVELMLNSDSSGRLKDIHDRLVSLGLKTKLSANTDTLLFEAVGKTKERIGLAALRSGNADVFSLPRPYWVRRSSEVDKALSSIHVRHFIEPEGFVSASQYSLRQIRVSEDTIAELREVIDNLVAPHAREVAGDA